MLRQLNMQSEECHVPGGGTATLRVFKAGPQSLTAYYADAEETNANSICLVHGETIYTYRELFRECRRFADYLSRALGVSKGDDDDVDDVVDDDSLTFIRLSLSKVTVLPSV